MNSKSWLVIILLIVFSIGAGFGGYYLGKYIDTKALDAKSIQDDMIEWKTYDSGLLKVHFTYPPDWTVSEKTEKDGNDKDIKKLSVKSPNGSELVVYNSEGNNYKEVILYCDKNSPTGNDKEIQDCLFYSQNDVEFGRYVNISKTDSVSIYWSVTELIDGKYMWRNNNYVEYVVKSSKDMSILDLIMISLTRE